MPASIGYLVIDTTAPERLAAFWCRLLEVTVDTTIGDGQFIVLSPSKGRSPPCPRPDRSEELHSRRPVLDCGGPALAKPPRVRSDGRIAPSGNDKEGPP